MDLIQQILDALIPAAVGGGAGWLFHREKSKSIEIANKGEIIVIYKEALDDLKARYEEKFEELQKEIDLLRRNVELWKGKYRDLKKEFEAYKQRRNGE